MNHIEEAGAPEAPQKLFSVVVRYYDGTLARAGYCWASTRSLALAWAETTAIMRGEDLGRMSFHVEEA